MSQKHLDRFGTWFLFTLIASIPIFAGMVTIIASGGQIGDLVELFPAFIIAAAGGLIGIAYVHGGSEQ